ncbi:unnamed protein product [Parascedosporium putredinis]|uniref:Glucose-methanol-choline oxidoreductase N-terminal domain-containing protein n=1 Tax=Parascedosporium putredinis TaxID=1442378 RepID=A0A9P1M7B2_9PEZI|nr:unnamed protein product [Parascedosporium putredinis]CAI7990132.1 unnamed protein product [Parascedosporium putredinis]
MVSSVFCAAGVVLSLIAHVGASSSHSHCEEYDYIVVGGGTSGLVVANRLTENRRTTVLVIERGGFANGPRAIIPYWANDLDTSLMIRPTSAPNPQLHNLTIQVAVPAVVGGATVINGMAYMRGSRTDYDAWEELGNPGWGWRGLLPYFRKSSTFAPPSPPAVQAWNMTWDPAAFGSGPVYSTIADFQWPDLQPFWSSWRSEPGIPQPADLNSGHGPGAYWGPSTIDRRDMTRTTARKAYYDPVFAQRPNLRLLTEHTATQIVFRNLRATGVKVRRNQEDDDDARTFCARKEVILAAGAIQTPHLLQVSGVGPKHVLQAAGIPVVKHVPGVGANFQDHATVFMIFNLANASFPNPGTMAANATARGGGGLGHGIAAVAVPRHILSRSHREPAHRSGSHAVPAKFPGLRVIAQGFQEAEVDPGTSPVLQQRIRLGSPVPGGGVSPGVMLKPLSRGTVTLDPADPHGLPVVQYNTFMNPVDAEIAVSVVKRARAFWSKPDIAVLGPSEISPGAQHQTDEEILAALKNGALIPSLAHPSGSCSMMPEDLGGCVGPDLKVHGLKGLSIIDASVIPMIPGAPLQATVYAIAEKAADIIKSRA